MYNLDVTDYAEEDLDSIIAYMVEKLFASQAAIDFADAVYDCYSQLEDNPYVYEQCSNSKLQKEGYRRAIIKNYILLYKIDEEMKQVIVHRFFYGGQDYHNQL